MGVRTRTPGVPSLVQGSNGSESQDDVVYILLGRSLIDPSVPTGFTSVVIGRVLSRFKWPRRLVVPTSSIPSFPTVSFRPEVNGELPVYVKNNSSLSFRKVLHSCRFRDFSLPRTNSPLGLRSHLLSLHSPSEYHLRSVSVWTWTSYLTRTSVVPGVRTGRPRHPSIYRPCLTPV